MLAYLYALHTDTKGSGRKAAQSQPKPATANSAPQIVIFSLANFIKSVKTVFPPLTLPDFPNILN